MPSLSHFWPAYIFPSYQSILTYMSATAAVRSYFQYYCLVWAAALMRSWNHNHTDYSLCITSHVNTHTAWQECAQKRLVHVTSNYSWFERRNVCMCMCLCLCACVQCHVKLSVRKRRSINTPGRLRFHVQGGAVGHAIHISITFLLHDYFNRITFTITTSFWHSVSASTLKYGKKECSHTVRVREREICYVHQQWFSLKIKQTHYHCLATTHPTVQTSRLSFIQRHVSLKETHTLSAAW